MQKADLEALKELKLFDFDQEKENLLKLIREKEVEKENEIKIFAQISKYLQTQRQKLSDEKGLWDAKKADRQLVNSEVSKKVEVNLKSKTDKLKHLNEE